MKRIFYDKTTDEITIKCLDFGIKRFVSRMNDTYKSMSGYQQIKRTNIVNLFNEMKYISWSESEIKFFNFFAIEVYELFADLGEQYMDDVYKEIAEELYSTTWISNFERKEKIETPTFALNKFTISPKDFQLNFIKSYIGLKMAHSLDGYVLSFEQGLGKTFTAIALAECLSKEHIYIICPNSLKDVWAEEIKKYYKKYQRDENLFKEEVYVIGGNSKYKINKNNKFFICNQESIQNLFPFVDPNRNNMILVDESHNFRGLYTKRVELLLKLKEKSNCHDCLMMSGTPIKAIPNEMVPTLRMIDPHFTATLADIYYKTFTDRSITSAVIVKERFKRVIYRKLKKDTLKLPEKHISEMKMKIPKYDKFLINSVSKDILDEYHYDYLKRLKSGLFTNNKLSPFYRSTAPNYDFYKEQLEFERIVRKYSRTHTDVTQNYLNFIFQRTEDISWELINAMNVERKYFDFLNKNVIPFINDQKEKYKVTKDFNNIFGWAIAAKGASGSAIGKIIAQYKNNCFIQIWKFNSEEFIEMINNNIKKTVIFTSMVPTANYISDDLSKKGIKNIKITGEIGNRLDLINKFKQDDDYRVLIATTQTLANGVTLTEATQMFFFGTPYRSVDFEQACDRIHRIGQTDPVFIYNILLWSKDKNITNRIDEIMNWSGEMFDSLINENLDIPIFEEIINNYGTDSEKKILKNIINK